MSEHTTEDGKTPEQETEDTQRMLTYWVLIPVLVTFCVLLALAVLR